MSPAPRVLRDANVLIVGGGASGAVAAAMLHERGVKATLIEQQEDFLSYEVSRSYVMGVSDRGTKALKSVPGLYEYVRKAGTPCHCIRRVMADGSLFFMDLPVDFFGVSTFFTRFRLLHTLKQYIAEHTNTKTYYGVKVTDIQFLPSGDMDVMIRHRGCDDNDESKISEESEGKIELLRTRFIIACDGRNSTVVQALRKASSTSEEMAKEDGLVHSKQGFEIFSLMSPSVGLKVKSIVMKHKPSLTKFGVTDSTISVEVCSLLCETRKRSKNRQFRLTHFPITTTDQKHLGGVLMTAACPADNALWESKSEEEYYELFQENFPEVDVRACVTSESMRDFARSSTGKFPPISRPRSISASIGAKGENQGGVVIVGDAAHCFPPDLGLGVNAALEDLTTLMSVIDTLSPETSIDSIVRGYDAARDDDIWALMRIVQIGAPYQYGQSLWGLRMFFANYFLRKKLSTWFPNIFHPALMMDMRACVPYSEKLRNANKTTQRIWVAFAFMLIIPALLVALILALQSSNVHQ